MKLTIICLLFFLPLVANSGDIVKSSFYRKYLSDQWRELFDYYAEECKRGINSKSVLQWTEDCIYVCDTSGTARFLDRRRNPYNVGLGSKHLHGDPGATRSYMDGNLYADDPCPPGKEKESLIDFMHDSFRDDNYALICNEDSKVEFLSLRFSRCPSGIEFAVKNQTAYQPEIGGDCTLKNTADNSTQVALKHDEFESHNVTGSNDICFFHYCCDAVYHTFTGHCNLDDFCQRNKEYEDAHPQND